MLPLAKRFASFEAAHGENEKFKKRAQKRHIKDRGSSETCNGISHHHNTFHFFYEPLKASVENGFFFSHLSLCSKVEIL